MSTIPQKIVCAGCAPEPAVPPAAQKITCGCCPDESENTPDREPVHSEENEEGNAKNEVIMLAVSASIFFATLVTSHFFADSIPPETLGFLYAIPYVLCGSFIFRAAWINARAKDYLNEFSLMTLATVAAIILGELPEAVGVMLFYRVGEFFQERAAAGSRRSIKSLLASKPTTANVLEKGTLVQKKVEDVLLGQTVQVRAGEKIPLDGVVLNGQSSVDQSPLTGESVPVSISAGSAVLGGTLNLSGVLTVEVQSVFADTHMARILEMVEHAAKSKSPTERFITRFARYYTPAVVAVATLVALLPPLFMAGETFSTWVYRALVLLVISCPCALIISIPLGYFGGIGAASRKGILVKGGNVLDSLMHVNTVIFDKTGTLTKGIFAVTKVTTANGVDASELLHAVMLAEFSSNHPIARSINSYGEKQGISDIAPLFEDGSASAEEVSGKGMVAHVNGVRYLAGTAALLADYGIVAENQDHPGALVYVAKDTAYLGCLLVSDEIKPESASTVSALTEKNFKTFMLTGDREQAAAWVAKETGVTGYRAGLLPDGKVAALQELADSNSTAFVGDGINDAPILTTARVGIAMGGAGSEAAIEAADVVILNDSPAKIVELFTIAKDVRTIVWQNIALALGVKTSFMFLGVIGLSGLWEAVFADVGVALLAVLNSTRIMRKG